MVLKVLLGRAKEISPVMIVLALLLAAYYADLAGLLGLAGEAPPPA